MSALCQAWFADAGDYLTELFGHGVELVRRSLAIESSAADSLGVRDAAGEKKKHQPACKGGIRVSFTLGCSCSF